MTRARLEENKEAILLILAAGFVFVNAIGLSLYEEGQLTWLHLYAPVGWGFSVTITYIILQRHRPSHDPYLLPVVGLMTGWGVVLLDRLAPQFLLRQVSWVILGAGLLLLVSLLPGNFKALRKYRYTLLASGLLLLAATLILGVNPSGGPAKLWLKVPILQDVYFQPSELLKLLVVAFLASYFEERDRLLALTIGNDRFRHYAYIAPLVIMWSLCIVLLVWQKDLGAATLFFVVFLGLLILATGDWRYLIAGTVLLLIVGTMGYIFIDVVATRFSAWWNPWPNASGIGYQTVQSLYAMASGNIIGQGIGQGYPGYVPVAHTDFIFSAIAEEWGLVGTMAILACIGILAYRGFRIANLSRDLFSTFLASGITLMLAVQSIMIMAGVTKLIPLTGVTLPFVSYGGSSLVMSCLMIGILLKLSIKSGDHGPIADANGTW